MTELILFYVFGGLTLAAALGVVAFKNPVSSAFSLVLSFFGMAALYAMLDAHFLAVTQILVYAGAIMVLFVFVIMLLNLKKEELEEKKYPTSFKWIAGAALSAIAATFIWVFQSIHSGPFPPVDSSFGQVKQIAHLLFTTYWFPFELVSILLLVAVIGGVVLAKRELK